MAFQRSLEAEALISVHSRKSWYVLSRFEDTILFSFLIECIIIDIIIFLNIKLWVASQNIPMTKIVTLRLSLSLYFLYKRDTLRYSIFL